MKSAPVEIVATVTGIVGDDLIYALYQDTNGKHAYYFCPGKLEGYQGEQLKELGIHPGKTIRLTIDPVQYVVLKANHEHTANYF